MPPTLTEIDQVAGGITFHFALAKGEARNDGKFSGGTFRKYLRVVVVVVVFCLSAANRKESFYTTQCKHGDKKGGGWWVARSSHS